MWLLDLMFDVVGYATARALIPTLSAGRWQVQSMQSPERGFNWFGLKRLQNGALLIEAATASWVGVFFWIAILVVILAWVA